jgi:radical SAM protein with 4Fe4S-binding SPASM domain
MEQLSYAGFSALVHERLEPLRLPLSGSIEVTRRCPLTCVHCYNNLPMGDRHARAAELTLDEHRRILDELAEAGCLWLLYTGGEIFARRDFLDIYTHARKLGFLITLFTNGTLITPRIADHLARYRPFAIEITLYGRTRDTYERLTGVPGSYDRCLQGIAHLQERGLPLALKTVAVRVNSHEVGAMQEFAGELGLNFKFDAMLNPRLDCSLSPLAVRLSPEECVAFDLQDPARMEEWRAFARDFLKPVHAPEQAGDLYHCGGGVNSFGIDPYGGLSLCTLSEVDKYDLRQGSFRDGWHSFLRGVRARRITAPTKCTDCELKAMCGMCPANGELENGNPEAPVDFLCQVAHLRAYALELPVAPHGDCEYCPGGSGHERMTASLAALRASASATSDRPVVRLLPMAASSSGGCGGGCTSCPSHA